MSLLLFFEGYGTHRVLLVLTRSLPSRRSSDLIIAADYSQIELRLAAHMADVPALRDAFARGDDIHSMTATELFGEVTRDTRAQAKTINFAILYGISRWGLAGRLDVTPDEAQAMIDRYFERDRKSTRLNSSH